MYELVELIKQFFMKKFRKRKWKLGEKQTKKTNQKNKPKKQTKKTKNKLFVLAH